MQKCKLTAYKAAYFILGKEMLSSVKDTALADNIHPGDNGFLSMANFIKKALQELMAK